MARPSPAYCSWPRCHFECLPVIGCGALCDDVRRRRGQTVFKSFVWRFQEDWTQAREISKHTWCFLLLCCLIRSYIVIILLTILVLLCFVGFYKRWGAVYDFCFCLEKINNVCLKLVGLQWRVREWHWVRSRVIMSVWVSVCVALQFQHD